MKKENIILFILPLVLLLFGIFAGYYLGFYKAFIGQQACELEKLLIPSSPIITYSKYDNKNGELILDIENPGGMPITILTKSLMLNSVGEKPLPIMVEVPLNIVLNPYDKISIKLKLEESSEKFKVGDVLLTTITYSYPVSKDIYSVVHVFKYSSKVDEKGFNINELGNNADIRKEYNDKKKNNSK